MNGQAAQPLDAILGTAATASDVADMIRSLLQFTRRGHRCEIEQHTIRLDVTNADDVPMRGGGYTMLCCGGCTCGASADGYVSHIPTRFILTALTESAGRKIATYTIEDARDDDADFSAAGAAGDPAEADHGDDGQFATIAATETAQH